MSDEESVWRVPSKIIVMLTGIALSAGVTFNTWAVAAVYSRPTKNEVIELIQDKSDYSKDRSMILTTLIDIREDIRQVNELLRKHIDATVE